MMQAPFYKFDHFGDEFSLIVALFIGIGFGFFLERAGFGNARKLAAQFYFRDLRVLKVMFTAIITAMVGLFFLARIGFVDLSLVYLTPTFVLPQLVGGLILGVGFIIGGYCPGTSCVSAATGRIDGMVYVAGMVGGLLGFAELYPMIAKFTKITAQGKITLPGLLNIPYGVLVFAVVLMALGAFMAAEWAEKTIGKKEPEADALLTPGFKLTPVRKYALVLAGLGFMAAFAGSPYQGNQAQIDTRELALSAGTKADHVTAAELAEWLVAGENNYLLIDVREPADFAQYHIPGARNIPLAELSGDFATRNEHVVFYSEGGIHAAQAWLLLRSLGFKSCSMLLGGLDTWKDEILFPEAPAANSTTKEQIDFARRAALSAHFGGAPRGQEPGSQAAPRPDLPKLSPPLPTAEGPGTAPRPKKRKEGC